MNNIFHTELKRAFMNPRFILVFILAGVSFTYGYFQTNPLQSQSPVGALTAWQVILFSGHYGFFATAIAALPFADSLSMDKRQHLLESVLTRTGYKRYLWAKTLAVALSGAAAVLLPAILMLGICYLIYPAEPVQISGNYFNFSEIFNSSLIQPGLSLNISAGVYTALCLLFPGLFGAAYALLGMGFSFLSRNSVVALGLPFMCYSFGYYFLPTSRHLNWMISTRALLIPEGNLFSPILQFTLIVAVFFVTLGCFGKKETQILQ
jgi:hypothetical protein